MAQLQRFGASLRKERWESAFSRIPPLVARQDKGNQVDPNRVGGPSNPLLSSGGLGTGIAKGSDARTAACVAPLRLRVRRHLLTHRRLVRMHTRGPDPDRCVRGALSCFFARHARFRFAASSSSRSARLRTFAA